MVKYSLPHNLCLLPFALVPPAFHPPLSTSMPTQAHLEKVCPEIMRSCPNRCDPNLKLKLPEVCACILHVCVCTCVCVCVSMFMHVFVCVHHRLELFVDMKFTFFTVYTQPRKYYSRILPCGDVFREYCLMISVPP